MEIGLLIDDLDQLENVAAWGYDYAEGVPGLIGVDLPGAATPGPMRVLAFE